MEFERQPDFSGWATKANLKCSDGRTIMPEAFKHQDTHRVPLVWQHNHDTPDNVLGYAVLEHRDEGVYAYGFFNETSPAKHAKLVVEHGDISSLSIYANGLIEKSKKVFHGIIRELSLVLSGANPGAFIDNISLAHADGDIVTLEDEAIIYSGEELELEHADSGSSSDSADSGTEDGPTIQEVYDGMTEEQKAVVHYMVGAALEGDAPSSSASHSDDSQDTELDDEDDENVETEDDEKDTSDLAHQSDDTEGEEGRRMTRNVFEDQHGGKTEEKHVLSHDAIKGIVADAQQRGSLKAAVEHYALQHGIDNIDVLFPDAKNITNTPEFEQRRVEWVNDVINGTRHTPFSRIRSLVADITYDEARARGYIKGNFKKEEWFSVSRRSTGPTTVYKKQKLDRDDIVDITDFDVVAWLKAEMRLMLDEEIARAVLIGDGRSVGDDDKIKDPAAAADGVGIRSIMNEHDLYAATVTVDDGADSLEVVDAVTNAMGFYKGSGSPTFYTTLPSLTKLLLTRNATTGLRYWRTASDLASEMGVDRIVTVEVMEDEPTLVGIIVNLRDYTIGADRGGEVNFFDDFDIDYNQYKYLLETRISGALTKIRSALVLKRAPAGATLRTPAAPTFNSGTGVVTIPTSTGVVYKNKDTGATLSAGAQPALAVGDTLVVEASPTAGNFFSNNQDDDWSFRRPTP